MLRKLTMVGLLVVGAMFDAPDAKPNATTSDVTEKPQGISVELGRADFRTYCAACHGVGGKGDGTIAEFLTIEAADLTKLAKLNGGKLPRERIREVIDGRAEVKVHGSRDMPVWGDWFDAEAVSPKVGRETRELIVSDRIESLINYIETLQEK
jgi:mono/diheme cytochrome c family protein